MEPDCRLIARLLDEELRTAAFRDRSNNGLQIENDGPVTRLAVAVDASLETFDAAARAGAQMLIVHHGLSWGDSLARIDGLNRRLVAAALSRNLALYASHLPLDAHPTLGNNAQIAALIGLTRTRPFMEYHGQRIGVAGLLPMPLPRDAFAELVRETLRPRRLERFDYGPALIRSVGVCSGGAPEGVDAAAREGLDLYLCGEANLQAYNLAKQWGQNALFAGHYATERTGPRALGLWLAERTGLPCDLIDFDLPY